MMLDKLKNRLKDEDYDLSFQEFIKKLDIEEDFKKYEDAYVDSTIHNFDRYVKSPEWSAVKEEFSDRELINEARGNLRNYITSVVNSSTLWGYDEAYNLVPDVSLPIAKMIASCISVISVFPEIKNECETGRAVSMFTSFSSTSVDDYKSYLKTLNRKMTDWFKHYLRRGTLRCLSGNIGGGRTYEYFIDNVAHTLTHIAIYKTVKKSDYFIMSMHSIFEVASLRFILQELKDELDIRIFYDGSNSFPLEMYHSIFDNIKFKSTYSECYNKSVLNDIWEDKRAYHIMMCALYREYAYLSVEADRDANSKLNKVSLIADAIYDKDSYLIVNKGTEAEKNIDQIIKSNPEYSAFYSVEL